MISDNLIALSQRRIQMEKERRQEQARRTREHFDQYRVIKEKWPIVREKDDSLVELSKFVKNEKIANALVEIWIDTVEKLKSKKTRKDFTEIKAPMHKSKIYQLLNLK